LKTDCALAAVIGYCMIVAFVAFRVSHRQREMYCGHARLCVCLSAAACPHYCTDSDVTSESGTGCPIVVHYWADLQSVHGLRCYGNITRTRNVSEYMLVLALRQVGKLHLKPSYCAWSKHNTPSKFTNHKNSCFAYGIAFLWLLLIMEWVQNETTTSPIGAPEAVRRDVKHAWNFLNWRNLVVTLTNIYTSDTE